MSKESSSYRSRPLLRRVDRAVGDLRRGLPVVVDGPDGASLVFPAELLRDADLTLLAKETGADPYLILTAERANVLHVLPSGHDVQLVPVKDRFDAETIRSLADPTQDLTRPLRGPFDQIKERPPAYAAAAVALCKFAHLLPAAVGAIIPGTKPSSWAAKRELLCIAADDVTGYEAEAVSGLEQVASARVPLGGAEDTRLIAFRPRDGGREHYAIVVGDPTRGQPVLTRLHSECFTGDLLGSLKCDCGDQLRGAIQAIAKAGGGVLLYMMQEGRGIGLINKLRAYRLQDQGHDTIEANLRLGFGADERLFEPAAEMLRLLGISKVRLMTNNPDKVDGLATCGIEVVDRVAHAFPPNAHNEQYLQTKKKRSGHFL